VRAVNLIPDAGHRGGGALRPRLSAGYVVIGVLAIALVMVTLYVLATNSIGDRKAKLAGVKQEAAEEQAAAARLSNYTSFAQLAQARAETVRQIAATRFDWHRVLSDLSKVVPANTSLQSLVATVSPTTTVSAGSSSAGAGSSGIRTAVAAPAFVMTGCTQSQDDVARLMARLRLMTGVTRVTLGDSAKPDSGSPGVSAGPASASAASAGCGANRPSFDLVVFFQPPSQAASSGLGSAGGLQVGSGSAAGSPASSSTAPTASPAPNSPAPTGSPAASANTAVSAASTSTPAAGGSR
jgi:Tfp pilus assembly protein PilN